MLCFRVTWSCSAEGPDSLGWMWQVFSHIVPLEMAIFAVISTEKIITGLTVMTDVLEELACFPAIIYFLKFCEG